MAGMVTLNLLKRHPTVQVVNEVSSMRCHSQECERGWHLCTEVPRMGVLSRLLMVAALTCWCIGVKTVSASPRAVPNVTAKAAVLMDAVTGSILWAKQQDLRCYPASTTKIATAIVAVEKGRLNRTTTVSDRAAGVEGSSIYLQVGEKLTQRELLLGAMLGSGNDASIALAEAVSGSVEEFVTQMNKLAVRIGAESTNFTNPNGLPDPDHYTTAGDLALMTRYGMSLDEFRLASGMKEMKLNPTHKGTARNIRNHNKLLWSYDGADGVKTGYTSIAGKCLVASATRDDWQLIAVVLGSRDIWIDSKAMLDYGFEKYRLVKSVVAGQLLKTAAVERSDGTRLRIVAESTIDVVIDLERAGKIKKVVKLKPLPKAPIKKGQVLGRVEIWDDDGRLVARSRAVAAHRVPGLNRAQAFWGAFLGLFKFLS